MNRTAGWAFLSLLIICQAALEVHAADAVLPAGVTAVWDLSKAARETTPTRQQICINGLWRWQPAKEGEEAVPADRWGFFKVPGAWPGISDYMQKDSQTLFAHPDWKNEKLSAISAAWYQREISIPDDWKDRRIYLSAEYLNSFASVYIDGKKAGEARFPVGEVDLSAFCHPGEKHLLSMQVIAMPLKAVLLSYSDTANSKEVKGSVARRGLCGDVYLCSGPKGARIEDLRISTSVRKGEIHFDAWMSELKPAQTCTLRAQILRDGKEVATFSSRFMGQDLEEGHFGFVANWKPDALWDLNTPQNMFTARLAVVDEAGNALDTYFEKRFGYRELWIDGRDFYLNGSRIFLSAVPLDNAQIGAAAATYEAAKETFERLKTVGINFVYTHNYDCEPGSHLSFEEILRAADDSGMLVALTQPHFGQYDWKAAGADEKNGYARHAAFYAHVAASHPSVVFYSTSHNATGYGEDMNPDQIGIGAAQRDQWASNNVKSALRAEAIIHRLDPTRIVYHHSSGNLSSMYTANFYANFAPIQELSDWFEQWSLHGQMPAFLCEYGVPFTWDWTMYRGWYKGQREFGSAKVPWEFCVAEWNAQFFGDRAFKISDAETADLRWEAKQFSAGNLWHRWDYPADVGSSRFTERYPVFAAYIADNWRAFRTWGLSGNSPWEYEHYWTLRPGVDRGRKALSVDWQNLQRPGFSADYLDRPMERMDVAYGRNDWQPTAAAQALIRNNRPLLAYIAGQASAFTSKDHQFLPGQKMEKQLIVINNSRATVTCDCKWSLGLPALVAGQNKFAIETGEQARIPLRFDLPANLPPGKYVLSADVRFSNGETQSDSFEIDVLVPPTPAVAGGKIAIFDPKGETGALLNSLGIKAQRIAAGDELSGVEMLIIGKAALSTDGPAPDLRKVRDGLKVIVFEQTSQVLEQRLGFRVNEYGLRQVFARQPDHPALAGLKEDHLRDWNGEATLLPPRLDYTMRPRYGPTVLWCDIQVPRVWRCGNRGNVASVLIEKPARGDFRPILDGGYSLQYAPLMEYREGKGMILFCQMDVTGRTTADPAAQTLVRNLLRYTANWKPSVNRMALYAGDAAGKKHLDAAGIAVTAYEGGGLKSDQVLIAAAGAEKILADNAAALTDSTKNGAHLLLIDLDASAINRLLAHPITTRKAEHISAYFNAPLLDSPFAGIGPADTHCRQPLEIPLVTGDTITLGDGALAGTRDGSVIFCQLTPWQFSGSQQFNTRRTFRRQAYLLTRLLGNLGIASSTPLLERSATPLPADKPQKRFAQGLYLDQPEEWDDPYRFFRW